MAQVFIAYVAETMLLRACRIAPVARRAPSATWPLPTPRCTRMCLSTSHDSGSAPPPVPPPPMPPHSAAPPLPRPEYAPGSEPVDAEDAEDYVDMWVDGPVGSEWGGPTRGGELAEPTRFGDWERKGRCTDF